MVMWVVLSGFKSSMERDERQSTRSQTERNFSLEINSHSHTHYFSHAHTHSLSNCLISQSQEVIIVGLEIRRGETRDCS